MIMLEECGLDWTHVDISIRLGAQFTPEYLKLSPNNKIPAIVDTDGPGGGRYTMMESGAILIYLAEKTNKFLPTDERARFDCLQWLIFQMAHVGPMFGQANHYIRFAKEDVPYAKERYHSEVLRLYSVLENRQHDWSQNLLHYHHEQYQQHLHHSHDHHHVDSSNEPSSLARFHT